MELHAVDLYIYIYIYSRGHATSAHNIFLLKVPMLKL